MPHRFERLGKCLFFWHTSSSGKILPLKKIPLDSVWKPPVDWAIQQYRMRFGSRLLSVYLRGSVAIGRSIARTSDIDTVGIIRGSIAAKDKKTICDLESIPCPYEICPRVDFSILSETDMTTSARYRTGRLLAMVHGFPVWGKSFRKGLPYLSPGPEVAAYAPRLQRDMKIYQSLLGCRDVDQPAIYRWILKRIVRAAFETEMKDRNDFSLDTYTCGMVLLKHHPQFKDQLLGVLDYLLMNKPISKNEIREFIDSVGYWALGRIRSQGLDREIVQLDRRILREQ